MQVQRVQEASELCKFKSSHSDGTPHSVDTQRAFLVVDFLKSP